MEHIVFSPQLMKDEIIIYDKERFYPKLDKISIVELTDIFCVGTLAKTRCFSINARPVQLTEVAKRWLGISYDDYTISDINSRIKGKNILVVRTDTSNVEKYIVLKRKFGELGTCYAGYPYMHSFASIEHDGEIEENISLRRIFMSTSEAVKSFTLDPNV